MEVILEYAYVAAKAAFFFTAVVVFLAGISGVVSTPEWDYAEKLRKQLDQLWEQQGWYASLALYPKQAAAMAILLHWGWAAVPQGLERGLYGLLFLHLLFNWGRMFLVDYHIRCEYHKELYKAPEWFLRSSSSSPRGSCLTCRTGMTVSDKWGCPSCGF